MVMVMAIDLVIGTTYLVHIPLGLLWRIWGVGYGTAYRMGIPWDYWWGRAISSALYRP